jgi:cyclic pyranopterin phosphate synthase
VKLYAFDGIDASLELIPLAARRALDALGQKLSLDGFLSLPLQQRIELTNAGSGDEVDLVAAHGAIAAATPPAIPIASLMEPPPSAPPDAVRVAFGPGQPLHEKVWQQLSPLDRYVLAKVTEKNRRPRVSAAYAEIIGAQAVSTHIRPQGGVHMVRVSKKETTERRAVAESWITMSPAAFMNLRSAASPKGDVLSTARLAGIMATKRTSDLIPLCHPLALEHAEVDFEEHPSESKLRVTCAVEVSARTGVEMEALMGATIATLTIYDMLKSLDRTMHIGPTRLLEKSGGRSGTFSAEKSQ